MSSNIVDYDVLIERQDAAVAELLSDNVDFKCFGTCGEIVPVPKALAKLVDAVYCDDCAKGLLWSLS